MSEKLGRFGHHPEPDMDFLVECECLEGIAINVSIGFDPPEALHPRLERALDFNVVLPDCVAAKNMLRRIASIQP